MGSHVGLARQLPLAPVKVVGAIDFISWLDINFVCGDRAILKEVGFRCCCLHGRLRRRSACGMVLKSIAARRFLSLTFQPCTEP